MTHYDQDKPQEATAKRKLSAVWRQISKGHRNSCTRSVGQGVYVERLALGCPFLPGLGLLGRIVFVHTQLVGLEQPALDKHIHSVLVSIGGKQIIYGPSRGGPPLKKKVLLVDSH